MPPKPALYTARKLSKTDNFYGPFHGSSDGDTTFCGLQIDH